MKSDAASNMTDEDVVKKRPAVELVDTVDASPFLGALLAAASGLVAGYVVKRFFSSTRGTRTRGRRSAGTPGTRDGMPAENYLIVRENA